MYIILLLASFVFVGTLGRLLLGKYSDKGLFSAIFASLSAVCLFVSVAILPLTRACDREQIKKYEATRDSIAAIRKGSSEIERAALIHTIISINRGLASAKYWNESRWCDWYIVDELASLEPLK